MRALRIFFLVAFFFALLCGACNAPPAPTRAPLPADTQRPTPAAPAITATLRSTPTLTPLPAATPTATFTPRPTATRTATLTATRPSNLSLSSNQQPPGDVQQVIQSAPTFIYFNLIVLPIQDGMQSCAREPLNLLDVVTFSSPGWQPGDTIKVTVTDPQGKLDAAQVTAADTGHASVTYQAGINRPAGVYHLALEAASNRLECEVEYRQPQAPGLYLLSDDPFQPRFSAGEGHQRLLLVGFSPDEAVRLVAYTRDLTQTFYQPLVLAAWGEYRVDQNGRLVVESEINSAAFYLAVGGTSGEVHLALPNRFSGQQVIQYPNVNFYCQALPSRIQSEHYTRILSAMPLYADSSPSSGVLGQLAPGEVLPLVSGPVCTAGQRWWKVASGGTVGWVREADGNTYLIAPEADAPTPTPTSPPGSMIMELPRDQLLPLDPALRPRLYMCRPSLPARVQIGMRVRAVNGPEGTMSLYAETGFGMETLVVSDGSELLARDGPICSNHMYWWLLEINGQTGWAPESINEVYRLEPLP